MLGRMDWSFAGVSGCRDGDDEGEPLVLAFGMVYVSSLLAVDVRATDTFSKGYGMHCVID